MIDRVNFYAQARALFGGTLTQPQVDGINAILDGWDCAPFGDLRWLAYILATTKHETANTMQPIREYGKGAGQPYGVPDPVTGQTYYGRGFVQLTWKDNYRRLGDKIGRDLVGNPDLALQMDVATDILLFGMALGLFTGVGLPKYFNDTTQDWINARRIVNGLDEAPKIAAYAQAFWVALKSPDSAGV